MDNDIISSSKWLVTGAAGFIGNHLAETILKLGGCVVGCDNFFTGSKEKIENLQRLGNLMGGNFEFRAIDIRDQGNAECLVDDIDYVLHQAAIGSVPLSIEKPMLCHDVNLNGTTYLMEASRRSRVKAFVYASSCAVYGQNANANNIESDLVVAQTPYAASKRAAEIYADSFASSYSLNCIGLRYYNVYGPGQDPSSAYAAVIPKWIENLRNGRPIEIYGNGNNTRDFIHVSDVVRANIIAATNGVSGSNIYNVSNGKSISLNRLKDDLLTISKGFCQKESAIVYRDSRAGDIFESGGSNKKILNDLGFSPKIDFKDGLEHTFRSFANPSNTDLSDS